MGHYLIIRLLKIEDNGEFKLRDTIDDVKIKEPKIKKEYSTNNKKSQNIIFSRFNGSNKWVSIICNY